MRKKLVAAALAILAIAAAVAGKVHLDAETDQEKREAQPLVITEPEPCITGTVIAYGDGVRESVYNGRIEIENDGRDGNEIRIFVYAGEGGLGNGDNEGDH